MMKVKSDGNGGYDINVQKDILKRWGPAGLAIFMLLSGLGTNMGSEVWDWVVGREAVEQQVASNAESIKTLRIEIREDIHEIRQGQARLSDLLLESLADEAAEGDK